mmetsp:Transcript_14048/g.28061  ORF Transcript_14048/g.28061 Transcript_14048/m.28061 type:complete len:409 (+) Transcript_14048:34-1260(+)
MSAMSIVCKDCNKQFKSAEEVQAHAEETFHTNFEESTEAILNLTCKTCGKPCRSETEKDIHSKRNPGHDEFEDMTGKDGAVTYGAAGAGGDGDVDMDAELKKAIAMSEAEDDSGPKVPITDKVNGDLMTQLKDMGFPDVRAEKALWLTGNENLEAAITWLADHGEDADIDEQLMVSEAQANKPKMSKEEQKALLEERLAKMRREKARQEKELAKQQELARIQSSKEMHEARKLQKEQEEKLRAEKEQREKDADARARAKIKAELEKDKRERMAKLGIKPEEAAAAASAKPADPYKERRLELGTKLRDLIGFHRNDPTTPNPATKAVETANKYVENIIKNPTEDKFRAINLENAAFQRLIGGKKGGMEMMAAIGFKAEDAKLKTDEQDMGWLQAVSTELQTAAKRGPFY